MPGRIRVVMQYALLLIVLMDYATEGEHVSPLPVAVLQQVPMAQIESIFINNMQHQVVTRAAHTGHPLLLVPQLCLIKDTEHVMAIQPITHIVNASDWVFKYYQSFSQFCYLMIN